MKAVLEWAFGERFIYRTVCNALEVSGLLEGLQEKGIEIALLVTDLNMPDMRGDVLLEKIWEQNFRIPAIVVTGEADLYQTKLLVKKGIVKAVIKNYPGKIWTLFPPSDYFWRNKKSGKPLMHGAASLKPVFLNPCVYPYTYYNNTQNSQRWRPRRPLRCSRKPPRYPSCSPCGRWRL